MFIDNPTQAASEFPDLIDELRIFFRLSTNPFADSSNEAIAKEGRDLMFEKWKNALNWVG